MSQRIREIEHPQGRYSPDSSACLRFPVRTILWKLLTFVLCEAHAVWVNTGLLPSATISVNNGKPLDLKSYKLLSVLRKLNYECLQNTAGVQATAHTIDTCSHSWQLIIPPWMRIKRTLSLSPTLIWWMISWENSRAFFAFWNLPPAPRAYTQNTLSTLPFPAHRPRGETDTFTRTYTNSHDEAENIRLQDPCLTLRKTRCVERIVFLCCPRTSRNGVKWLHNNAAYCCVDNAWGFCPHFFSCWWWWRSCIAGWWYPSEWFSFG